jgi:hypothetical protein
MLMNRKVEGPFMSLACTDALDISAIVGISLARPGPLFRLLPIRGNRIVDYRCTSYTRIQSSTTNAVNFTTNHSALLVAMTPPLV